jgi:nucleoid-associated protein YgaU
VPHDGADALVGSGQFERIRPEGPSSSTTTTTLTPAVKQTIHFVREGETLSEISRQYFGDRTHSQAIYDANKDKMSSIHALRPGVRLVIPVKKAEATTAALPATDISVTVTPTTTSTTTAKTNATLVDYKIQEGETLSTIAEKVYGSKSAWQKLYALNKDRVPNPNRMKPGTVISVPQKP